MGVSLQAIKSNRANLAVPLPTGEVIHVSYRPYALEKDAWERIGKNDLIVDYYRSYCVETVISWDLSWEPEDEPIPITDEALRPVPELILRSVMTAIQQDLLPNRKSSTSSNDGSQPAE